MRLGGGGRSSDLEDRRGEGGGGGFGGGGIGGRHIGIGGLAIILVLSLVFKRNFFALVGDGSGAAPTAQGPAQPVDDAAEEPEVRLVSRILDDAQASWTAILPKYGEQYRHAHLVLFRDAVQSACGSAESASGPFYCPGDEKVYLDLGFFDELKSRFGAPGDFAQAYVITHELGHHVQKILGTSDKVHAAEQRGTEEQANALSVKLELQADCYAGVWANSAQATNKLDPGDIDQGLAAAASVGDDRLQKMATGHVNPESFTHGTSAQRSMWFKKGFESGRVDACDTFGS